MKKMCIIVMVCCIACNGHTQTFSEWFRQAKTQKKYLLQQIAAYQLYLGYLKKGYDIVKNGNGVISTLKHEDMLQHKDKYARLKKASPVVRNYGKVSAIINLQTAILPIIQKTLGQLSTAAVLSAEEKTYIQYVFQKLLEQCNNNITELNYLVTDGKAQLSDDERMHRIDQLYADMHVKYTFAYSFSREAGILRLARSREAATIENRKTFHQ